MKAGQTIRAHQVYADPCGNGVEWEIVAVLPRGAAMASSGRGQSHLPAGFLSRASLVYDPWTEPPVLMAGKATLDIRVFEDAGRECLEGTWPLVVEVDSGDGRQSWFADDYGAANVFEAAAVIGEVIGSWR